MSLPNQGQRLRAADEAWGPAPGGAAASMAPPHPPALGPDPLRALPHLEPRWGRREGAGAGAGRPTFNDREPRRARGLSVGIHGSAAVHVRVLAGQLIDLQRGRRQGNRASPPFLQSLGITTL